MRRLIRLTLAVLWVLLAPAPALANGNHGHTWITLKAIELLPKGPLKTLLERPDLRPMLLNGTIFPDGGYAASDDYGEIAHWEPFLVAYLQRLQASGDVDAAGLSPEVAFVFGVASHQMADQVYDAMFMAEAKVKDAAGWTDEGVLDSFDAATDMFVIAQQGPSPYADVWLPMVSLQALYDGPLAHKVAADVIESGQGTLHDLVMATLPVLAADPKVLDPRKARYPWAWTHLFDPMRPGSPPVEAQVVARYWQALWARLHAQPAADRFVISAIPSDGHHGHPTAKAEVAAQLVVAFGRGIDHASFAGRVRVVDAAGNVLPTALKPWLGSPSSVLRVVPLQDWPADAKLTLELLPGIAAIDGAKLEQPLQIHVFTSAGQAVLPGMGPLDPLPLPRTATPTAQPVAAKPSPGAAPAEDAGCRAGAGPQGAGALALLMLGLVALLGRRRRASRAMAARLVTGPLALLLMVALCQCTPEETAVSSDGAASSADTAGAQDGVAGADAEVAADGGGGLDADGGVDAADVAPEAAIDGAVDVAADDGDATAGTDANTAADSTVGPDAAPLPKCATSDDCYSASPCMIGSCTSKGTCAFSSAAAGTPCSDGNACTTGDSCTEGACSGPSSLSCDDENACTTDKCNPIAGCINLPGPASAACDDGDPCTQGDSCDAGQCLPGVSTCQCKTTSDCLKFEDGDQCNGTLYCDKSSGAAYTCKVNPATVVSCPKVNDSPCQKNTCVPATGQCKLQLAGDNSPCDDGNACSTGDYCELGLCQAGTNTCVCKKDSDCNALEDGDLCNGTLFCNKATAQCQVNPITVVKCQTVNDTQCLRNACHPKEGKCHLLPLKDGKVCDDGNPCTPNEGCSAGECVSAVNTCECQKDADCLSKDDGNLCNGTLYCDLNTFKCRTNPATVVTCNTDDDPACLSDVCDKESGKCQELALPKDGTVCDDGNPCTPSSHCSGGQCAAQVNICPCQLDGDCAVKEDGDVCNGGLFCHPKSKNCEVNPATVISCSDAFDDSCLTNQCDQKTGSCGMKPAHQGNQCDDGSLCSGGGWCSLGTCEVTVKLACECAADSDCAALEDGDFCNGTLYCDKSGGAGKKPKCAVNPASIKSCQTVNDTACLANLCQKKSGLCQMTAVGGACDDGKVCTVLDGCLQGVCAGLPALCDDSLACTLDLCKEPQGCLHLADGAKACEDGNPCTAHSCEPKTGCQLLATPVDCSDANPCTEDSCHPVLGCGHSNTAAPCSDGNPCTQGDACSGGICQGKLQVPCDDSQVCTADACDPKAGGCVFLPLAATCSDGIGCTHSDACTGGKCVGTFGCDDGNPCTFDGCNAKIGDCVFLALDGTPCDDGTPCTVTEACKSGQCLALKVLSCDDGNSCTSDACDKLKGCYHYDSPLPCSTGGCYADDSCVNATCKAGTQARLGAWPVAKQEPGSSAFDLHDGILQPDGGLLAWGASAGGYFGGFGAGPGWVVRTDKLGKVQWQAAQLPIGKHSMGYVVRCFQESAAAVCFGQAKDGHALVYRLATDGSNTVLAYTYVNLGGSESNLGGVVWRPKAKDFVVAMRRFNNAPGDIAIQAVMVRIDAATLKILGTQALDAGGALSEWLGLTLAADGLSTVAVGRNWKEPSLGAPDAVVGYFGADPLAIPKKVLQLASPHHEWLRYAIAAPDGGLLAVGGRYPVGTSQPIALVVRLDGNGKQLWEKVLGEPPLHAEAWGALQQPDGSAVITGSQRQPSGDFDAQLWRLDALGNLLATAKLGKPSESVAYRTLTLADGDLLTLGRSYAFGNSLNWGMIWRTDPWLHTTCSAAGACAQTPLLAKVDPTGCTAQTCTAAAGVAKAVLASAPCTDGDACTKLDNCQSGGCAGVGYFCDDGNPCTLETCDKQEGCIYSVVSDGAVCGAGKACLAGSCL